MKKLFIVNLVVISFCLGYYLCYFLQSKSCKNKIIKIVYQSKYYGCQDPYTNNIRLISKKINKEIVYSNKIDSLLFSIIPESQFKPKITRIMKEDGDYRLFISPKNWNYPNFYHNSYLLTRDSLYLLSYKPIEIRIDTLIESLAEPE